VEEDMGFAEMFHGTPFQGEIISDGFSDFIVDWSACPEWYQEWVYNV